MDGNSRVVLLHVVWIRWFQTKLHALLPSNPACQNIQYKGPVNILPSMFWLEFGHNTTGMSCVTKTGGFGWVGDGPRRKRHKTSSKIIENLDAEHLEM